MAARRVRFLFFRRRNRRLRGSADDKSKARKTAVRTGPSLWRRGLSLCLRLFLTLGVCALLGAAGYGARYFVYHSPRFALHKLRVSGARRLTTAALQKRAAVALGTNLFQVDTHVVEARLLADPWLSRVSVRRELPETLRIEVTEHEPTALLALESLYLCDAAGEVFKRAAPAEVAGLPVVTGVGRATYVLEPAYARAQIGTALSALARYQQGPAGAARPAIGEVHVDRFVGVTLYTRDGLAIELGRGEPAELSTRLERFDAVWRTLQKGATEAKPVMVFLDNRAHPDHVIVRF